MVEIFDFERTELCQINSRPYGLRRINKILWQSWNTWHGWLIGITCMLFICHWFQKRMVLWQLVNFIFYGLCQMLDTSSYKSRKSCHYRLFTIKCPMTHTYVLKTRLKGGLYLRLNKPFTNCEICWQLELTTIISRVVVQCNLLYVWWRSSNIL